MASTPSGPTLTCAQCSFVNEAERVYCHNCGAKLDRTLLPKADDTPKESLEKTRKRVQKITNPGGLNPVQEAKTFANTIIYAVLVALIVQFVREPADVPSLKPDDTIPRMVSSEILEALENPKPLALQFTEADVNHHLRSSLKSKAPGLLPGVKFERAWVHLTPGNVYIGLQQSVMDFPIYSGVRYDIGVKDGKFFAENQGGNFGRINVHPLFMKYLAVAFKPLFGALKREHSQMDQMQIVRVDKGTIYLATKANRTPAP